MMNDEMGMMQMMQTLQGEGGIRGLLQKDVYQGPSGHTYSQADLLADIINILRLDQKQLAEAHGVEIEVQRITPQKLAQVLEQMIQGNTEPLVELFNGLEEDREQILREVMTDEQFEAFSVAKQDALYSTPKVVDRDALVDEGLEMADDAVEKLAEDTDADAEETEG